MLDTPSSLNPPRVDDLVRRWQIDRDEQARDELLRTYMRPIKLTARKLAFRWGVDADDAIQEAALGFMRALDLYEPTLASLQSYMARWAKAKVNRLRGKGGSVSIPAHIFQDSGVIARAANKLRNAGRAATMGEIATELSVGAGRVQRAMTGSQIERRALSLAAPVAGEGSNLTVGDTLADDRPTPDVLAEEHLLAEKVWAALDDAMAGLHPRHREVVQLHLIEGLTLDEVGERMGFGRQRGSQILGEAVPRLREALVAHPVIMELLGKDASKVVDNGADEPGELLSVAEVEKRTGLSRGEMSDLIGRGTFPRAVMVTGNGNRRWSSIAVERWLAHMRRVA